MFLLTFFAILCCGGGRRAVGPALLLFFGFSLHLRLLLLSLHLFLLWLYCIGLLLLYQRGFGFITLLHGHNHGQTAILQWSIQKLTKDLKKKKSTSPILTMLVLPAGYSIITWTYLHFYIRLLLSKIFIFLFYVRFGFSVAHVRQGLLGAQLSYRGWRGHPVIDTCRCLGQLEGKKKGEILITMLRAESSHTDYIYTDEGLIISNHLPKCCVIWT